MMQPFKELLKKYKYESIVFLTYLISYFSIPVLFNYIDGILMGTVYLKDSYPHYPFFYPLLVQATMFFTGSFCMGYKVFKLFQFIICCSTIIYAIRSVPISKKKITTILLLAYTPIIIFQCNILTDSLFVTAEILLLATIFRWSNYNSKLNVFLHLLALIVLLLVRHTGVLFGIILPLYFILKSIKNRGQTLFYKSIQISFGYGLIYIIYFIVNLVASNVLNTKRISLYGRPAMHIIVKTYEEIPSKSEQVSFRKDWVKNARNEEDKKLQNFILESGNEWNGPRSDYVKFISEKYPTWSEEQVSTHVDLSINTVYWQYFFSGNTNVYKAYFSNFISFLPLYSNFSREQIKSQYLFFVNGINNFGNYYQCNFNDSFKNESLWLISTVGVIGESLINVFLFLFIIYYLLFYRYQKKMDELTISILFFILINSLAMTIFTIPLERYLIPNFIALIFIVIEVFPEKNHLPINKLRR